MTIHLITIVLVVLPLLYQRRQLVHILAAVLISGLFPVGGPLTVLILYVLPICSDASAVVDPFNRQKADSGSQPLLDLEHETNIAPLEEILMLSEFDKRREVILNLLKKDKIDHPQYIDLALHNDDSETAHYAASSILKSKRQLDMGIQQMNRLYDQNQGVPEVATAFADLLEQYLHQASLDPVIAVKYQQICIQVLMNIVTEDMDDDSIYLLRLINHLLEIGDFQSVSDYCKKLSANNPDTEDQYLILLKSYYMIKDKRNFDLVFKNFLSSDIKFSNDTINIVRLWLGRD